MGARELVQWQWDLKNASCKVVAAYEHDEESLRLYENNAKDKTLPEIGGSLITMLWKYLIWIS